MRKKNAHKRKVSMKGVISMNDDQGLHALRRNLGV